MENQAQRKQFLINTAYWAVLLAIVYFVLKYLINLVMPFFLALIIAAIARPLARLISRPVRGKVIINKKLASIISVILIFIILIGIVLIAGVRIVDGSIAIIEKIPGLYYSTLEPGLQNLFRRAEAFASRFDPSILEAVQDSASSIIGTLGSKLTDLSGKLIVKLSSLATSIPSLLLNIIICLIATVFISLDFDNISAFFGENLPSRSLEVAQNFRDSLVGIVWQFIRSYFLIFLITTAEITLGFFLVGQARPFLLGILIAIFDAFPIVGSGMILLPLSVGTLIAGKISKGLGLLLVWMVVVIVRQIIEPRIVGRQVGLMPIVTLICMYIGTKLFGGIGLFALPILAAIISELNSNGTIHLFKPILRQQQEKEPSE